MQKRVDVAELVESVRLELGIDFTRSVVKELSPGEVTKSPSILVNEEIEDGAIDATALLSSMKGISSGDELDVRTPVEARPAEKPFSQKEKTAISDEDGQTEEAVDDQENAESDDVFEENRKQLFNPPEKREGSLIRTSAIIITLALLLLFGYYAYTSGYFNSYLPDYLKYKQAPLRDRMDEQQLIDQSSLHSPRQQTFSFIMMESVS